MKAHTSHVNKGFAFATGTALVLCALTASLGAEEPARVQLASMMQSDCDRMAGSPHDQQRNSAFSPVGIAEIDDAAVDACRVAFESSGNPRYAYQLGRALNKTAQADQAMSAYEVAVQAGYPAAKVNFGTLMGRLGDEGTEFRLYMEAAQGGNVLAAYNLGVAYRDGLGTQQDVGKALTWFEKAAADGDDTAAFNIGAIYDEGQLVKTDDQLAIAWYDVAAQRGNTDAMINLALMYEAGEGMPANMQKAADLYRQAAQNGDLFGAYKFMQMQELGVPAPGKPAGPTDPDGSETLVLKPGDVQDQPVSTSEI